MSKSKRNEVGYGIILSYILIILNACYGLFVTPYILGKLGPSEYGVYKTISSLSSALMVLDLGVGGTIMRYMAKYRATKNEQEIPNFLGMMFIQAVGLCIGISLVGIGVFHSIDTMYAKTFTATQLTKAHILFGILMISLVFHIVENVMNGIITGCNNFTFGNGIKLVRLVLRILLIITVLWIVQDSVVLALIDLCITILMLSAEIVYIRKKLGIKVKFSHWDRSLFMESGIYTLLMFLTSIAAQVNNNLDNVIIGAISGPALVAIYSFGLVIFSMYEQLSTAVSGVMLPTVTNILERDIDGKGIQNIIVGAGRLQFMLLGAAVVGFICIGKQFIQLWLGPGYEDVYTITLILMIPSLFELCVNVCLSILRAKNMLGFRTIVLTFSTVLNAVVTVLAVKYWSYVGAAFGTAASFIVGSIIVMNIYYYKKLKLPMFKIYSRIFSRIWLCLLVGFLSLTISAKLIRGGWLAFITNVAIFSGVYGAMLLMYGISEEERKHIPVLNKLNLRKKEKNYD